MPVFRKNTKILTHTDGSTPIPPMVLDNFKRAIENIAHLECVRNLEKQEVLNQEMSDIDVRAEEQKRKVTDEYAQYFAYFNMPPCKKSCSSLSVQERSTAQNYNFTGTVLPTELEQVQPVVVNQTTSPTYNVQPPVPAAGTQHKLSSRLPEEVSNQLKEIGKMYKTETVGAHLLCIDERTIFKNELGKKNTRIGGYTNAIKTFIEYLSQKHNGKKGEELLAACPALRCLVHSTPNAIVTTCGIRWQRRSGVVSLKIVAKLATLLNWNVTFACEPDPRPQKTNTLVNIYITTSGK